jgi:hypothetical protein
MQFNSHYDLTGKHSYLSASSSAWVNYDDEKFDASYRSMMARAKGTEIHAIAESLIRNRIKLPRNDKTLNRFVNDAIGYRMDPEVVLRYSDNAFGTADAICYRKNLLRIHDLKTGTTPANMRQLCVYAAYFCLEYMADPLKIGIELRKYQLDEIEIDEPDPDYILFVMDKIRRYDQRIEQLKMEE